MGRERDLDPRSSASAQYGYRLRHHRKEAGLSQDALGARFNVTGQMIGHIESGRRMAASELSRGFDNLFELDSYFEELWWHVRREQTPDWFEDYQNAEGRATSIRVFEPLVVNGVLQTEQYAQAVLRSGRTEDRLDQAVASRMARQEILTGEDPPWLVVVLFEAAIRRPVGDSEVMRGQLQRLLDAAAQPNIALHIVPSSAGVYPSGGMTIFSFDDQPDLGFVEAASGHGQMLERQNHVEGLKVDFDRIRAVALPAEGSVDLIRAVMESM